MARCPKWVDFWTLVFHDLDVQRPDLPEKEVPKWGSNLGPGRVLGQGQIPGGFGSILDPIFGFWQIQRVVQVPNQNLGFGG